MRTSTAPWARGWFTGTVASTTGVVPETRPRFQPRPSSAKGKVNRPSESPGVKGGRQPSRQQVSPAATASGVLPTWSG